jgi:hypothetical protein
MPSSRDPRKAPQAAQEKSPADRVREALSALAAAVADPLRVDSFLTYHREGVTILRDAAAPVAAAIFLQYMDRISALLGESQPQQRSLKGALKETAWTVFWKGVMGVPPPLEKKAEAPAPKLTDAERSNLRKLYNYLAEQLSIAVVRTAEALREKEAALPKTGFEGIAEYDAALRLVGDETGKISKAKWLDYVLLRHGLELERAPVSEVAWSYLARLVDREWLERTSATYPELGVRKDYLMKLAASLGNRSKIYRYILQKHGVLMGAEKAYQKVREYAQKVASRIRT